MSQVVPPRDRWTLPNVAVVAQISLGVLLVVYGSCCGSWQAVLADRYFIGGAPPPHQQKQADRFLAYRHERLPWHPLSQVVSAAGPFIIGTAWLIGGIGIWRESRWSRTVSLSGAILAIVLGATLVVNQVFWVDPTVREFFQADVIQLGAGAALEATLDAESLTTTIANGILAGSGAFILGCVLALRRPAKD